MLHLDTKLFCLFLFLFRNVQCCPVLSSAARLFSDRKIPDLAHQLALPELVLVQQAQGLATGRGVSPEKGRLGQRRDARAVARIAAAIVPAGVVNGDAVVPQRARAGRPLEAEAGGGTACRGRSG